MEIPLRRAGFPCVWTGPVSRVLFALRSLDLAGSGDHLSGTLVAKRLERHSALASGTALHAGKDLIVAPPPRDGIIPLGNSQPFGVDVTVGTSVLADDGRYPLPSCLPGGRRMPGLSSPLLERSSSPVRRQYNRGRGKAAVALHWRGILKILLSKQLRETDHASFSH